MDISSVKSFYHISDENMEEAQETLAENQRTIVENQQEVIEELTERQERLAQTVTEYEARKQSEFLSINYQVHR